MINNAKMSPALQAYVNQQNGVSFNNQQGYYTNSDLQLQPQVSEDTVEIGKKKKSTLKKVAIATGIVAASALAVCAAFKVNRIHKAKKDITKIYDGIFEQMKEESEKLGIDFIKPELKFAPPSKKHAGVYISGSNIIEIPRDQLDYKAYRKPNVAADNLLSVRVGGMRQVATSGRMPLKMRMQLLFNPNKNPFGSIGVKKITYDEFLLNKTSLLTHELTHAKQDQILLNTEGGIEKLFELLKIKDSSLTFEKFLENYPLYKTKIPNKKFKLDTELVSKYQGRGLKYKPINIAKSKADYTTKGVDYFTNFLEADARVNEIGAVETFKKLFPNTELDETILKNYERSKTKNVDFILDEIIKRNKVVI